MPKITMEKKEQLSAWSAQARGMAASASLSWGADAGTGHQHQAAQQEPEELSVSIECHSSSTWLWGYRKRGPDVKQITVSFKRRPPKKLGGSCLTCSMCRQSPLWKGTLPQQQDGLEDRELQQPDSQGQGFSLRVSGAFDDTPGQVILEQLGCQAPTIEPMALTGEQEREDAIDAELSEEEEWADAMDTELSEEEEWEDAIDTELSEEEEWEDATDIELSQGTGAIVSPPVHHWVNSLGLEDNKGSHAGPKEGPSWPSSVGREAAGEAADKLPRASPAPVHLADAYLADSAPAVAPEEDKCHTPLQHEEAEPPASPALVEAATAAGAESQAPAPHGPTASDPFLLDTARSVRAEGLGKAVLVVQGLDKPPREMWGQERSRDKVTGDTATAEGAEDLENALHSPTADASLLLNTADYIRTEIIKTAWLMVQEPVQEPEEEWEQEGSMDKATAATAKAAGAEALAYAPYSPTGHYLPLLDMADYIRTEVVKKAWLVVQRPFQEPEYQQDWEQSPGEATAVERPAGYAYCLPAPIVINAPTRQRQLSHAQRALRALPTASTTTCSTGERDKQEPTASATDLLDTAQYSRGEALCKAMLEVQRPGEQTKEQKDLEQDTDEGVRLTAPEEGTETPAHALQSPTVDDPPLLDTAQYIRNEVLCKAALLV